MTKVEVTSILELRDRTGAGIETCVEALKLTDGDLRAAEEYLKLRSQAFSRKKKNDVGEFTPWETEDYLKEAYKACEEDLV